VHVRVCARVRVCVREREIIERKKERERDRESRCRLVKAVEIHHAQTTGSWLLKSSR